MGNFKKQFNRDILEEIKAVSNSNRSPFLCNFLLVLWLNRFYLRNKIQNGSEKERHLKSRTNNHSFNQPESSSRAVAKCSEPQTRLKTNCKKVTYPFCKYSFKK